MTKRLKPSQMHRDNKSSRKRTPWDGPRIAGNDVSLTRARAAVIRDPVARSAVTNGSIIIPGCDMRQAWARRYRDLLDAGVADLGGPDNMSNAETALCRHVSWLILQMELIEERVASKLNGVANARLLNEYQKALGAVRRTLQVMHSEGGLQRRQRDITPVDQHELRTILEHA